jgi:hypothetical protein
MLYCHAAKGSSDFLVKNGNGILWDGKGNFYVEAEVETE